MSRALETASPPSVEFARSDRVGVGAAVGVGVILAVLIAAGGPAVPALVRPRSGHARRRAVVAAHGRLALVSLPIEGIFWVALYPHTAPAALAKDFLFVVPAYIGFFYSYMKSKQNFVFPGFPLLAWYCSRDWSSSRSSTAARPLLVGPVGAKFWLFYMPMAFLG